MSFEEKYRNRNFIKLFENRDIKKFILNYPNETSRRSILSHLYSFYTEAKKLDPEFTFERFFESNPLEARETIWGTVLSFINLRKYRTANTSKVYGKALYDFVNEEKGISINFRRNQQVPSIKVKAVEVPTHQQIYRLIDYCTHLKVKAIIALSYVSGTKAEGIRNLRIKDVKDALKRQQEFKQQLEDELKEARDVDTIKELEELLSNLPLVIKITAELYPKRFRNATSDWYPAIVSKDAQELLLKHYNRRLIQVDSEDSLLFVTLKNNRRYSQPRLSYLIKYNIKKFSKSNNGELKHTSPSMLRKAFFNKLIAGGMKDIYREVLMGHDIGVKSHYFEWDIQRKEILLTYIRCHFDRNGTNGITREITRIKEDSQTKDERIKLLEKELNYFKSPAFTKDILAEIKSNGFKLPDETKPKKVITKVIDIGDKEAWKKLNAEGYVLVASDDEHFVLEKEIVE